MEALLENMKTAVLNRQLARSERHTQEAEEKKKEFLRELRLKMADQEDLQEVKSALNGADAENKRNQLMVMSLYSSGLNLPASPL